eukprot:4027866-Pyramimonas_sp.AAC.1
MRICFPANALANLETIFSSTIMLTGTLDDSAGHGGAGGTQGGVCQLAQRGGRPGGQADGITGAAGGPPRAGRAADPAQVRAVRGTPARGGHLRPRAQAPRGGAPGLRQVRTFLLRDCDRLVDAARSY